MRPVRDDKLRPSVLLPTARGRGARRLGRGNKSLGTQEVMRPFCSDFRLTGIALAFGAVSSITLALAVATDYWLFMSEPYKLSPAELAEFNLTEPPETNIMIHVRSGLWRVCTINIMNGTFPDQCLPIDYTLKGNARLEGAPTSMTIVGAIRGSSPLLVAALMLTLAGMVMSGIGILRRNGKSVVAAVVYVLSGLCLAVGIILYISAINDEVGYRSQIKGGSRGFTYYYGWSFFVAAGAFVSSEMAAVMCVTLYLRHNARVQDMVRIIPGLEEKLQNSASDFDRGRGDRAVQHFSWE